MLQQEIINTLETNEKAESLYKKREVIRKSQNGNFRTEKYKN